MKKAFVIFFCFQIISGNMFASEVLKLPFLLRHYLEHERSENSGLGFGEFLWEHYVVEDHTEKGHCDEKLPFKHCHDCCSHQVSVIVCTVPEQTTGLVAFSTENAPVFHDRVDFISFYQSCIWQPPKI